ncbi:MAG TPA: hypothetical protein VN719_12215 [Gemmatimonadales bacterium]|jgi:hypothetical protein|nr:hypothetical protein [Gemmatimonadales bacterium]
MSGHHVGRLGHRGFVLRYGAASAAGSAIDFPATYWEIEFEGRIFPWRPVHPGDEADLPQLIRTAIAYLKGELHRSQ